MMLIGEEIQGALGKHIIIYPFDPSQLRGSNYNLKVGKFIWLHQDPMTPGSSQILLLPLDGVSTRTGRRFDIPPGASVSVLTKEIVYIDNTLAGLFHSKVDMVTKGFSHISTTLDPGWTGPLLITMKNNSAVDLPLWQEETFVKLSFHRLSRPTKIIHNNPPGRSDLLRKQRFRFPEGEEDFLDEPVNCQLTALRQAFFASTAWKVIQNRRVSAMDQGRRWVVFCLALVVLVAAVTSPWWFPLAFGVQPGDEALAAILATAFAAFFFFIKVINDPPWRSRYG